MTEQYKLKEKMQFRCGVSSFELSQGAIVHVIQKDYGANKVLISFGGRDIDWYSDSILNNFEKV